MVLLPEEVFSKLSVRYKRFLYIAVLMVGLYDFLSINGMEKTVAYITGRSGLNLTGIVLGVLLVSAVIGIMDIYLFCTPLHYFFKNAPGHDEEMVKGNSYLKLLKVYAYSYIPIMIVTFIIDLLNYGREAPQNIYYDSLSFLIGIWLTLIIAKGCNIIYGFKKPQSVITFFVVFFWISVISYIVILLSKYVILLLGV
jgi:hypothetical protein